MAYHNAGRPDDALQALEAAVTLQPDQPRYFLVSAMVLEKLGRHGAAQAAARRALALDRNYTPAAQWLAERRLSPR